MSSEAEVPNVAGPGELVPVATRELFNARGRIVALEADLREVRAQLAEVERKRGTELLGLEEIVGHRDWLLAELERAQEQTVHALARAASVEQSRTWRLTAPLRRAARAVRRSPRRQLPR